MATTHIEPSELTMPANGLQGSIHRLSWSGDPDGDGTSRILFSGADHPTERVGMTVWLSKDEGQTWPVRKLIDPGPSAYSDLVTLADSRIGLLYELGGTNGIDFVTFTLDWLTS
jgi:sialidase-1